MSTKPPRGGRFFPGWWMVLVAASGMAVGYGPVIIFTFSVFLSALSQEFAWSRTELSFAYSLAMLGMSGVLPFVGRLVDRYGARRVILPSVLIFGGSLISCVGLSTRLWHFYAMYLLLGISGAGTYLPYFNVIPQWFNKQRGLALGLAATGIGLGQFTMPSLAQFFILTWEWRIAYLSLGLIVIGVAIPLIGLFLIERPQELGLLPDDDPEPDGDPALQNDQLQGLRGSEAWRTAAFWLMCSSFFFIVASLNGCLVHLVAMLTDQGVSAQRAAFVVSLFGGVTIVGRIVGGYLMDRFFAPLVAACFFCGAAVGIALLWSSAGGAVAFVAALLMGLGWGVEADVMPYLVSRYFGLRAFGEIYAYIILSYTLGGAVGPLVMGIGFDVTGSYQLVLSVFIVASLVAAGLLTRLGPYRRWEAVAKPAVTSSTEA